jgi:hypothetical protein
LAKRKLDPTGFIKAQSGFARRPERVKRMKSEVQLTDSLAHICRANKDEQTTKETAASATIEKSGPAVVKRPKQRMDVSKITMPDIRELSDLSAT